MWTIKINCRRVLGRLPTNLMTLLFIQIYTETNIFLSTKVIWVREKKGFISYSSAWGSDRRVCSKILPSRKKRDIFMNNGNESWDVLDDLRKRYRGPWAEKGKYWPGKEPIRLQNSLPCPLKKKKKMYIPHLYSWLFCTVKKNLFNRPAAHAALVYPLCFSRLMRNE